MAEIVERKSEAVQDQGNKTQTPEYTYAIYPDIRRTINYDTKSVELEISLPGVKKEDIKLLVLPEIFHLTGQRGQMQYCANQSFGVEVVPEKTQAKYENGLLRIKAFIKDPMDAAKSVAIQ